MGLILPFRANRLAFPGTVARVDPAHPASNRLILSAAGTGGGFKSLLPAGQIGLVLTPTFKIDGLSGPSVVCADNTTQAVTVAYGATGAISQYTMAVIGSMNATSNFTYFLCLDGGGNFGLAAQNGFQAPFIAPFAAGAIDITGSTRSFANSVPYFYVASQNLTTINWVIKRLDTGVTFSGTSSGSFTAATPTGPAYIGNRASSRSTNAPVAAAMASGAFLSLLQLLQWADDPWSFWYSQRIDLAELLRPPPPSGPTGPLAVTEPTDVAAFAGSIAITGTLATTEAADIAAFTGTGVVSGSLATTEAADIAAFTGTAGVNGILATTEATDVAAFTGPGAVSGSLATTEATDVAAFAGNVGSVGVLAATEAPDVTAFAGTFTGVVSGTLAATELTDAAAFAGSAAGLPTGSLAALELPDNVIILANYKAALQPVSPSPYPSPLDYGWYNSEPDVWIDRGRPGGGTQD